MTAKTEPARAGGYVLTELGHYARDVITLASGNDLQAGAVLAKLSSGEWAEIDFSGSGDAAEAAGILFQATDASDADTETVAHTRGPVEVMADKLIWPDGATAQQKSDAITELEALGIIARSGPSTVQVGASVA